MRLLFSISILFFLAAMPGARAQSAELPGDKPIDDLELTRDYVLEIDGKDVEGAEIYHSRYEVAYLVVSPELPSALLFSPRGRSVQSVDGEKLAKAAGLAAKLGAGAAARYLGQYEERRGVMSIKLEDGRTVVLGPRPPLLGRQSSESVEERHPRYGEKARAYRPKKAALSTMAIPQGEVRVRVYFASWSPICERLVPKVVRVEQELRGRVRFEYYGLPKPLSDDPVAARDSILSVPTVVVYVDDEEIGRLSGRTLDKPEAAFSRLFKNAR